MKRVVSLVVLILLFGVTGKAQQQVSISTAKTVAINSMRYNRQMYSEVYILKTRMGNSQEFYTKVVKE